jgi:predicted nuclease of predicted toxin-antitoxin system
MVFGEPKLLLINTGNISNEKLEKLLKSNLLAISDACIGHRFIELTNALIVVHQ